MRGCRYKPAGVHDEFWCVVLVFGDVAFFLFLVSQVKLDLLIVDSELTLLFLLNVCRQEKRVRCLLSLDQKYVMVSVVCTF